MAALFGDVDFRLNSARLRRCIYSFYGLPHFLTEVHWDKNSRQVERFHNLCRVWKQVQEYRTKFGLDKFAEDYYNRSQFRKICTMHWWHATHVSILACGRVISRHYQLLQRHYGPNTDRMMDERRQGSCMQVRCAMWL